MRDRRRHFHAKTRRQLSPTFPHRARRCRQGRGGPPIGGRTGGGSLPPSQEGPCLFNGCNFLSPNREPAVVVSPFLLVTSVSPALAVIDGTLCQLTREGTRAGGHAPLATAIVEFRHGSMRYYVRELSHGLLPGIPNLYCLDAAFRMLWMAEWPDHTDPCASIVGEQDNQLVALSAAGVIVRLDPYTGQLLRTEHPFAAAS